MFTTYPGLTYVILWLTCSGLVMVAVMLFYDRALTAVLFLFIVITLSGYMLITPF